MHRYCWEESLFPATLHEHAHASVEHGARLYATKTGKDYAAESRRALAKVYDYRSTGVNVHA